MTPRSLVLIAALLALSGVPVAAQEFDPDDILWGYQEAEGDSVFARYEFRWLGGPLEIAYAPYGRTPMPLTDLRLSPDRLQLAFTWPDGARCELDGSPGVWSWRDLVGFRWVGECVPESGEPWTIAVGLVDPPDYGQRRPADELDLQIIDRAVELLSGPDSWNRNDDRLCEDDDRTGRRSLFCALHRASLDVAGEYLHARRSLDLVRLAIREWTGLRYVHTLRGYNNHPDTTLEDIHARLREGRWKVERELTDPFRDPEGGQARGLFRIDTPRDDSKEAGPA